MADARPLVEHVCEQCSDTFTSNRMKHRFCSYRCNKAWQSRKHEAAGYKRPIKSRICAWCGTEFARNRTDTECCSTKCGALFRSASDDDRQRRAERKARTIVRRMVRAEIRRTATVVCEVCETPFRSAEGRRKYCSVDCCLIGQKPVPESRLCIWCSEPFTPPVGQGGKRLCSAECKRRQNRVVGRAAKHTRRARKFDSPEIETVYRKRIFKRDGYRCQLCGLKLNMAVLVPHPDAATIDHILPLSKGGSHTNANVQAAHFRCNCLKHDRLLR